MKLEEQPFQAVRPSPVTNVLRDISQLTAENASCVNAWKKILMNPTAMRQPLGIRNLAHVRKAIRERTAEN